MVVVVVVKRTGVLSGRLKDGTCVPPVPWFVSESKFRTGRRGPSTKGESRVD